MITTGMMTSLTPEWATPQDLFDKLDAEFHFTLDPCCTAENATCAKFYTAADDGLFLPWDGERVFMNPPYGRQIGKWIEKAFAESRKPRTLVVCLLPARTDTRWFHRFCLPHGEIRFLPGRLYFGDGTGRAPFPSMVVIFDEAERTE